MKTRIYEALSVSAHVLGAVILTFAFVLIVLMPVARAQAPRQDAIDITGYYGEGGGEFFFRVSRHGEVYQVLEHHKAGDWIGVAIRDGATLAIGWHKSDGTNLGVTLYRIGTSDKGPTLTGAWAAYASNGLARTELTWSRKLE